MTRQRSAFRKIGITGAAGHVGSTLAEGLSAKYELSLYDRKGLSSAPEGASVLEVDFADRERVKGLFDGLDAVIHVAGDPRPNAPRQSTFVNNFAATSFVFDEARRAGVGKVLFASSNFYHEAAIKRALPGGSGRTIRIEDPPTPLSYYGQSKVFGEYAGLHLANLGIPFAALRIGWTVPGDDPRPYDSAYMRAMFCSRRDLVQSFDRALQADEPFLAAFAVSDNDEKVFDLDETRRLTGYHPEDNSARY